MSAAKMVPSCRFEGPRELGLHYPNPWFSWPSWALCDLPSLLRRLLVLSFKVRTEVPCLALSKTYVFFSRLPSHSRGKPTLLGRTRTGVMVTIEDALLTLFLQAVDVGTLKYVSAEAIRILIWVLGFMSFGQATEFSHYAIDEEHEPSVDPMTATEDIGIATSAGLVRRVFRQLSLIEMGETDLFPHVGRNTKFELHGAENDVYPVVTGTFGGGDFFHSVLGELSDKVAQSEIQSLEGVITDSQSRSPSESFVQDLLSMIPAGLVDDSEAQATQMEEFRTQSENAKKQSQDVSPREPEEWTCYLEGVHRQIHPLLEWHDEITKSINTAIEKIPVLPEWVELQTGSSKIIQSSREQQHIVFENDESSNPTHSMLSKDHFSNVLNEPAGRVASQIIKWTVPQLMECWDSEEIDITKTLDRIIVGVFYRPALRESGEDGAADVRQIMFHTYLRGQLTRQGVFEGKNHKEGVHDTGHGCGKPLALRKGGHGNPFEPSGSNISLGEAAAAAAGDGTLRGLVSGLEPYHEEASLEEQRPPWKVRHENYDEKWRGDHWNYEHESYDHYVSSLGSNGQTYGYNSEETYRFGLNEYSDGNGEHRYGYGNRPMSPEEYGADHYSSKSDDYMERQYRH
ncbi:heterokaryon incompatibility protein Het-C-domain-containing protein [Aspergillus caelatus]|uniref:Heterokaryon incompatibility protein Het-C-domain-containing protein n=1 Tax=Aspergillus caelatus TaxID=61420 RepID=A0A5N7A1G0_9EURO|nr:heterokaryon incompatibility protein Het-C-domain-containing protein [Aspergillus caelatus]KAE8363642.1 heterokaryon incompatibility protein Het-C-domain-containing protein [Aspergillus caelatus]